MKLNNIAFGYHFQVSGGITPKFVTSFVVVVTYWSFAFVDLGV